MTDLLQYLFDVKSWVRSAGSNKAHSAHRSLGLHFWMMDKNDVKLKPIYCNYYAHVLVTKGFLLNINLFTSK